MCSDKIIWFFGGDRTVISIKPSDADALWEYMVTHYKPGTYGRQIKTFKQIFNVAVREKWITENPFAHLKGSNIVDTTRRSYVTTQIAEKVMEACPNAYWRLVFALARYGGLRIPSELVHLKWSDVLWDQGKTRVSIPKKTGKNQSLKIRYVPLFPELVKPLQDYFETLPEGAADLMFTNVDGNKNLRRRMEQIVLRAGLIPWPKLFVNLRSTRETELAETYPLHKVCEWIGNSSAVMLHHYAQVTDDDFRKAAHMAESGTAKTPDAQSITDSKHVKSAES